jgi:hypothetical protein
MHTATSTTITPMCFSFAMGISLIPFFTLPRDSILGMKFRQLYVTKNERERERGRDNLIIYRVLCDKYYILSNSFISLREMCPEKVDVALRLAPRDVNLPKYKTLLSQSPPPEPITDVGAFLRKRAARQAAREWK